MPLHSEIKRRRQARIEQIKQTVRMNTKHADGPRKEDTPRSSNADVRSGKTERQTPMLKPPKDPEEAWKRRMAAWSGQPYADDDRRSEEHPKPRSRIRIPAWGGLSWFSLFLSVVLFITVWGLFQTKEPWAMRAQMSIVKVMNDHFSTERAANWYHSVFGGTPSWIPVLRLDSNGQPSRAVHSEYLSTLLSPVKGNIVTPFSTNKQGVQVLIETDQRVVASATGRIIFDGHTSSGRTVVIQHPDQVRTVYGWLEDVAVSENDWVEQGETIAWRVQEKGDPDKGVLYFSVRVGDRYVDPAEVVNFD